MNKDEKTILLTFGTRPELIKLAPVIKLLKESTLNSKLIIVNTNQHDELLTNQLEIWKIEVDINLNINRSENSLTFLLSHTLLEYQVVFENYKNLEYVIVQGDTNTALASSLVSFFNHKKLIHIEAGLRTGNLKSPYPEEFNRTVASKTAYFHFAPTEQSKKNLLREGVEPESIAVVGNTIVDALYQNKQKDPKIGPKNKILITLHRRENIKSKFKALAQTLHNLYQICPELELIWVGHPNNAVSTEYYLKDYPEVTFLNHLPYHEFIQFYQSSALIITDSGGVSEEAIQLGIPLVIYRDFTERTEALNTGYPVIVTTDETEIITFSKNNAAKHKSPTQFYGDGSASQRIVQWLEKEFSAVKLDTLIIGGGPAGTGILLKTLKDNSINQFLSTKIGLVERTNTLVSGSLTSYAVNSDTFSNVFLECLESKDGLRFWEDDLKEELELFNQYKNGPIPLNLTKKYFNIIANKLEKIIQQNPNSRLFKNREVEKIKILSDSTFEVQFTNQEKVSTQKIVIACGGIPRQNFNSESKNIIHSDSLLRGSSDQQVKLLKQGAQISIIGGGHSAFSAAHYLLQNFSEKFTTKNPIRIFSTEKPKIFFLTKEDAKEHNYFDFTEDDICPITLRVYRLSGLRMDGRQLYMNMLGLANSEKENRVVFSLIDSHVTINSAIYSESDFIIEATGYNYNIPKFEDAGGIEIQFKGVKTNHWVDSKCRLVLEDDSTLKNAFAVGMASGYIPSGKLGGEKNFKGQTNGIWYYQNLIADIVINQLQHEDSSVMS